MIQSHLCQFSASPPHICKKKLNAESPENSLFSGSHRPPQPPYRAISPRQPQGNFTPLEGLGGDPIPPLSIFSKSPPHLQKKIERGESREQPVLWKPPPTASPIQSHKSRTATRKLLKKGVVFRGRGRVHLFIDSERFVFRCPTSWGENKKRPFRSESINALLCPAAPRIPLCLVQAPYKAISPEQLQNKLSLTTAAKKPHQRSHRGSRHSPRDTALLDALGLALVRLNIGRLPTEREEALWLKT